MDPEILEEMKRGGVASEGGQKPVEQDPFGGSDMKASLSPQPKKAIKGNKKKK